ncbi:hypothetical protein HPP92_013991, partial [Vanilla planifolia]
SNRGRFSSSPSAPWLMPTDVDGFSCFHHYLRRPPLIARRILVELPTTSNFVKRMQESLAAGRLYDCPFIVHVGLLGKRVKTPNTPANF